VGDVRRILGGNAAVGRRLARTGAFSAPWAVSEAEEAQLVDELLDATRGRPDDEPATPEVVVATARLWPFGAWREAT